MFWTSEKAIVNTIRKVDKIFSSGFTFFKLDSLCSDKWWAWLVEYIKQS